MSASLASRNTPQWKRLRETQETQRSNEPNTKALQLPTTLETPLRPIETHSPKRWPYFPFLQLLVSINTQVQKLNQSEKGSEIWALTATLGFQSQKRRQSRTSALWVPQGPARPYPSKPRDSGNAWLMKSRQSRDKSYQGSCLSAWTVIAPL